jgi:hypothetical protein
MNSIQADAFEGIGGLPAAASRAGSGAPRRIMSIADPRSSDRASRAGKTAALAARHA